MSASTLCFCLKSTSRLGWPGASMLRQRGGLRQRLVGAARPPDVGDLDPRRGGELADTLLNSWAWGLMSSPAVQAVSLAAVHDGLQDPEVEALSRAGGGGLWPQNIVRDICRFTAQASDLPKTHMVAGVPVMDSRTPNDVVLIDVPVLLPHELFSYIGSKRQDLFASFTNNERLSDFWDDCLRSGDPHMVGHPMRTRAAWKSKAVPLLLHGDSGGYTNRDSLEVTSWGALLCKADTWRNRYIASVFVNSAEAPGPAGTMVVIWEVLRWSLDACFQVQE
jgi:hypothetical protein